MFVAGYVLIILKLKTREKTNNYTTKLDWKMKCWEARVAWYFEAPRHSRFCRSSPSMPSPQSSLSTLFVQAIGILIHQLLFTLNLYPPAVFKCTNLPIFPGLTIYECREPKTAAYIQESLEGILHGIVSFHELHYSEATSSFKKLGVASRLCLLVVSAPPQQVGEL